MPLEVIKDDSDIWADPARASRRDLYDEIAQTTEGTVRLRKGVHFPADEEPNALRQRVISAMRYRRIFVETRVKDGDIYVRNLGPLRPIS